MVSLEGHESTLVISPVAISAAIFSPSSSERVELRYHLSQPAAVTVKVFDPDLHLVRTLAQKAARRAGANREMWNGKDDDGKVVPDEAYFFVIEAVDKAGNKAVYDPITFSGGEFGDIQAGRVDRGSGTVSYELSQPSRVLLRAGIAGSAMLKTIVDWEPRAAGAVTEYWNGKDEDGLIDLLARKYTMVLTYTTLPETSAITYGNTRYSYRQYKASLAKERPSKESRPMANQRRISPHFLLPRLTDRAFRVKVTTPDNAKDRAIVRVDIDPADREILRDQQFEVILFVDTVFHTEEERGYVPLNVPVELSELPPGEHVITANIITFGGQIGVGSTRIDVVR